MASHATEIRKIGVIAKVTSKIERAIGKQLDGGARLQVAEALAVVFTAGFDRGYRDSAEEHVTAAQSAGGIQRFEPYEEGAEAPDAASELRGWWEQTAHDEVAGLTAKMIEYGGLHRATDLAEIGRGLVNSGVNHGPLLDSGAIQEGWYQELGCYFYLLGKFARWTAAVAEGRPVSDDTLLDIGIYVRMVQRIRHTGGWPV